MKLLKIIIFIISLSNIQWELNAQCDKVINLYTQEQVDSFSINYPGCVNLTYPLVIYGNYWTPIDNLKGLKQIKSSSNEILLEKLYNLTSLEGLDSITQINKLTINGNNLLQNFKGLGNLKSVDNLSIFENKGLKNFEGLEKLEKVSSHFYVSDNPELNTMLGLNSLVQVDSNFIIQNNNTLKDLKGLGSLKYVWGLAIAENASLENMQGLGSLCATSSLFITSNNSLKNLDGINNLSVVKTKLIIRLNNSLINIEAISNLSYSGSLSIDENEELKAFANFSKLDTIHGSLSIGRLTHIKSLSGFDSLKYIGNGLSTIFLDSIIDFKPFSNLNIIKGGIYIYGNNSLQSLSGLDNIDYQGIKSLTIKECHQLSYCSVNSICNKLIYSFDNYISGNLEGCSSVSNVLSYCKVATSSQLEPELIISPNPSIDWIEINGDLQLNQKIKIFDYMGREVAQSILPDSKQIDVSGLVNGLYFLVLEVDGERLVRKFVKE